MRRSRALLLLTVAVGLALLLLRFSPASEPGALAGRGTVFREHRLVVYGDRLAPGWRTDSWRINLDLQSARRFAGQRGMAFSVRSAWGALSLRTRWPIEVSRLTTLSLRMLTSVESQRYAILLYDAVGRRLSGVPLERFGGRPVPGRWTFYRVPLGELLDAGSQFGGFAIQDDRGARQPAAYVDSIVVNNYGPRLPQVATGTPNPPRTSTPSATPTQRTETPGPRSSPTPRPTQSPSGEPTRVIAYFPLWLANEGYTEKDVPWSSLTDIGHFSLVPKPDGGLETPDWGPFPDNTLVAAAHDHGVRVFLVIGGDHEAATTGFSTMAASGQARATFSRNVADVLDRVGYDGVELDWEFPRDARDRVNLTLLVRELRAAVGDRSLSIAGPASDWYGRWYDLPALSPELDWFTSMTYTFASASWSPKASHNSALHGPDSLDSAKKYFMERGVPARKIVLGIPLFGERFDGVEALGQTISDRAGSEPYYKDIVPLINKGWTLRRDAAAGDMPYLTRDDGAGLIVFDDVRSVSAKCSYLLSSEPRGGGVALWRLGQDWLPSGGQPLVDAVDACKG